MLLLFIKKIIFLFVEVESNMLRHYIITWISSENCSNSAAAKKLWLPKSWFWKL